jgi:uncharacterized repeat protein (TIGR01451 family)
MGLNLYRRHVSPRRACARTPRFRLSLDRLEGRITPALGPFELDGNAITQATHDWDQVYNDAVLNPAQDTSSAIPGAVVFINDAVNSPTDDIFTGGQSTDLNDLTSWHVGRGTPQSKADIADVFAVASEVQVGGQTHNIVNFGADRFDNTGNATMGFWFFQNPVSVNPNGTFSGAHAVGDILIVANFSSSVATFVAYRWVGPGGSTSSLRQITIDPADGFATVNTTNTPTGGWPFQDKGGSPPNTFAPGEFFEAGLDLTAVGLPSHLSTFLAETRASTSLNAALSDLVIRPFDTFAADLAVTKAVSNPRPNVGDTVTFTVTVTNQGPNDATGVQVTDLLPAGLSLVSANPAQGTYSAATGIWDVGTLARGATTTLTLTARVDTPFARTNTATAAADQTDRDPADNTASAAITPQVANLVVTKTVSDPRPNVGDTITFAVTVANRGPDAATAVQLTDLLPAGLAFVSAVTSQGTYAAVTGTWDVGSLVNGATATLQLRATVVSAVTQTNTATVSRADQFDPITGNNSASATETPQQADVQVSKSVDNPTPNVGDTVTYTIVVDNNGPDPATNVVLTDVLPAGLEFVSSSPTQGAYDPVTGIWTVGAVSPGAPQALSITAAVVAPTVGVNTAAVSHADQFDPNTANNTDSASVNGQGADLVVAKRVDNPTPNVGDTVTFTVTLRNTGPSDATGIQVIDLLPAGLTFTAATPSQGNYVAGTGVWSVGNLPDAAEATLTLRATVVSSVAQTNVATVSAADQFDPNAGNNSARATETPQQADLAVTKDVDNPTPNVGDPVTFTVTLTDAGPDPATNVVLADLLPPGLSFVSAAVSQGSYDANVGVWTVGTVAPGAPQTLTLTATVVGPSPQTNTVVVSHADQFDPDAGNNSASATETPQQADLALTKVVSDPTPNVGDVITFTVTLTNLGPDAATNVRVTDLLPPELNPVLFRLLIGLYDPLTGVWDVGTVPAGQSRSIDFAVRVTSLTPATNRAVVSHADQFDPVAGNNAAAATETPQQADLRVGKAVSNATPNVGDVITFTVTLTNAGPDTATGILVTDLLPAGLAFVSAAPSQGIYSAGSGVWDVGSLAARGTATLLLRARVVSPAARTNTAAVTATDQFDPVAGNNTASATETPPAADLAVTKAATPRRVVVGQLVTFVVTVRNLGPGVAPGVVVTDRLPAGLALVSARPTQGVYSPATGQWTVVTLAPGGLARLRLIVRVTAVGTFRNTAAVTFPGIDPNLANNVAAIDVAGVLPVTPSKRNLLGSAFGL